MGTTEDVLNLVDSVAKRAEEQMAASAAIAIGVPGVGTAIGAATFVLSLIELMLEDTTVIDALKKLQEQIRAMNSFVVVLKQRIEEVVTDLATESNRATLRDLLDYLDEISELEDKLLDKPQDVETAVDVARRAAIVCDKFLRSDFDIWRWTDVIMKAYTDPDTGQVLRRERAPSTLRFKNVPTLPIYVMGILTWLRARETVLDAGQMHRLPDDPTQMERHAFATSTRHEFEQFRGGHPDPGNYTPQTITEHIRARINRYFVASDKYARNHICRWYFVVENVMTGKSEVGESVDIWMPGRSDYCTVAASSVPASDVELAMERKAGVETLEELSRILHRGRLREPDWRFSNDEVFKPAVLYVIDQNAELQWYENVAAAARGGSKDWRGPKRIGHGWNGFRTVFNCGGHAIYGLKPNGELWWYAHDGFADGTDRWRASRPVGHGWNRYKTVFPGGEYVVYGIEPDGGLFWYRHNGAPEGGDVSSWSGPRRVADDWNIFDKVFSGGDGVIYGIRPDGVLERRQHIGYLTGEPKWAPQKEIGTGWSHFLDVVAASDGVIYAFTRERKILWYRYAKQRPPLPDPLISRDDIESRVDTAPHYAGQRDDMTHRVGQLPHYAENRNEVEGRVGDTAGYLEREVWKGPFPVKDNFPPFQSVFPGMWMPRLAPPR